MANINMAKVKKARYMTAQDITDEPTKNPNATKEVIFEIVDAKTYNDTMRGETTYNYTCAINTKEGNQILTRISFKDSPLGMTAFSTFMEETGLKNQVAYENFDPMELDGMSFGAVVAIKLNKAFDALNSKSQPFHPYIKEYKK